MTDPKPLYGIGAVVKMLQEEFPGTEVTVSKIRFLETEGIVTPARTPSGYRRFSDDDVERLRYTLRMQRDHFLPLRVIGEQLDQLERGFVPPVGAESAPTVPSNNPEGETLVAPAVRSSTESVQMSIGDVVDQSGLTKRQVSELLRNIGADSDETFDLDVLALARSVARCESFGVEYRHLQVPVVKAALRQAELIESILAPQVRAAKSPQAWEQLQIEVNEISLAILRVHLAALDVCLNRQYAAERAESP